jgi:hypothetical protein
MITSIRNLQIHPNGELPNDDYHGEKHADHVSGSQLCVIHNDCPAVLKYGENKESAALHFGIASHCAMLEPELFDSQFIQSVVKDDYSLKTDADIKARLKAMGIKGYSTFKYPELLRLLIDSDADAVPYTLAIQLQEAECRVNGQTIVKNNPVRRMDGTTAPGDYDQILLMRKTLFNDPANVELFKGATFELSIICEVEIDEIWYKVKIRPDIVTANSEVPDYKTTRDVRPEHFGRQAHEAGYWLKQAFVGDVLRAAYGNEFKMGLLAQSKSSPFIPQLYWMTKQQLQVGREQYMFALKYHKNCVDGDSWPAYNDGAVELPTPDWLIKRYGF